MSDRCILHCSGKKVFVCKRLKTLNLKFNNYEKINIYGGCRTFVRFHVSS